MTGAKTRISEQAYTWFFERDARAYPLFSEFTIAAARRLGAGADAEDVAQSLLFDLLRLRDRGALTPPNASELTKYIQTALRRRCLNLRGRQRRQAEGPLEDGLPSPVDAPDASLRALEYVELCVQIMRHALELTRATAATHQVMNRIFQRFVLCRDIESVLVEDRLLDPDATPGERVQARNTENRRQSRARKAQSEALSALLVAATGSAEERRLDLGGKSVPFSVEDVQCALRFAKSLGRSEAAAETEEKGEP